MDFTKAEQPIPLSLASWTCPAAHRRALHRRRHTKPDLIWRNGARYPRFPQSPKLPDTDLHSAELPNLHSIVNAQLSSSGVLNDFGVLFQSESSAFFGPIKVLHDTQGHVSINILDFFLLDIVSYSTAGLERQSPTPTRRSGTSFSYPVCSNRKLVAVICSPHPCPPVSTERP